MASALDRPATQADDGPTSFKAQTLAGPSSWQKRWLLHNSYTDEAEAERRLANKPAVTFIGAATVADDRLTCWDCRDGYAG